MIFQKVGTKSKIVSVFVCIVCRIKKYLNITKHLKGLVPLFWNRPEI